MKKLLLALITIIACSYSFVSAGADKIRFGVIYFYPPFAFSTKSGYVHGFDIEIATAICQRLKAECTFTAMPLQNLFVNLNQGRVDAIMGAIAITPERQTRFAFTQPYYKSTMSYVALNGANLNLQNLQGKRVGVEKDSIFSQYIKEKYGNQVQLTSYPTNEAMVTGLSERKIDVILLDTPAANYWVNYSTGLFKLMGQPENIDFDKGYGIAVKQDNAVLLNSLNNALTALIKDGTLTKIQQSYFKNTK